MQELLHNVVCVNEGASYCLEYEVTQQYLSITAQQVSFIAGIFALFLTTYLFIYAFRR